MIKFFLGKQLKSGQRFLGYVFVYNVSLVPCNSFNRKPIFKYIYLRKLVLTEEFWSTVRTNTLLSGLNIDFGIFKCIIRRHMYFFSIESFSLNQGNNVFLAFIKIGPMD